MPSSCCPSHSRWEKLGLAVLAAKLTTARGVGRDGLNQVSLLFKPDTLLRWHRELVRRKWTFKRPHIRPRRTTDPQLVEREEFPGWAAHSRREAPELCAWGIHRLLQPSPPSSRHQAAVSNTNRMGSKRRPGEMSLCPGRHYPRLLSRGGPTPTERGWYARTLQGSGYLRGGET